MDIKPILKRIAAGDRQAFVDVVRHYQHPLFGFLGRMGLARSHAEEIAQDTFLRAWINLGKYKPELAEFSTWLFTIARNLAWHELSRASTRQKWTAGEAPPEVSGEGLQPPEELALARQKRRLHEALLKLPIADRSAVALVYIKGLELAAIARIEGCTAGAVKTRVHRAKQKLRQLLERSDG